MKLKVIFCPKSKQIHAKKKKKSGNEIHHVSSEHTIIRLMYSMYTLQESYDTCIGTYQGWQAKHTKTWCSSTYGG